LLKDILQKHSKLKVIEAVNNMPVGNNKVYVLPPGYYMTIEDCILYLQKRTARHNCAIDIFMESLAADFKERSFGIILSGVGSNGLKGAASKKKQEVLCWYQIPSRVRLMLCRL
jgi:chemotaxis response regulator CheB